MQAVVDLATEPHLCRCARRRRRLRPSFDWTTSVDFNDTPAEAAFRTQVREFLDAHAPLRTDPTESAFPDGRDDHDAVEIAKQWQAQLFDAGWACLGWP